MKKVAIILSGCGPQDGSEIREALFAMLSLAQNGVKYQCFAIDKEQAMVYDHYHQKVAPNEKRNVLIESARLARGRVKNLTELKEEEFDGLLFPGGGGAGLNLANFLLERHENFAVEKLVEDAILAFRKSEKPLCFLCVSPVIAARVLPNVKITLGSDKEISGLIRKLGATVEETLINTPVVDLKNKLVTVPCYLVEVNMAELYNGIYAAVQEFIKL